MKRLYNWFHNYYGSIEKSLGPKLDKIINGSMGGLPGAKNKTALEYACGSGLLSLKLARLFGSVEGRDLSEGMIGRARGRAAEEGAGNATFRIGNILAPDEEADSYDYVFVSFALHLFSPETEIKILKQLLRIAREAVIIIDHGRKWNIATAIIEWLEGGYYDVFIRQDFGQFAKTIGAARFSEEEIEDCSVLMFWKQ
jgi:ubiquinone/menaquinone biosynthesis C-methylase UbiE